MITLYRTDLRRVAIVEDAYTVSEAVMALYRRGRRDFERADLRETDLRLATLVGADLTGADLRDGWATGFAMRRDAPLPKAETIRLPKRVQRTHASATHEVLP